jgi:dipeptidyl-peptidase-4
MTPVHHRSLWRLVPPGLLALAALLPAAAAAQTVDYSRAERFLGWNANPLVANADVNPRWLPGGDRFWYRTTRSSGAEFMLVDAPRGVHRPLFDNARLAAAMSLAADTSFDPTRLGFTTVDVEAGEGAIVFETRRNRRFRCDIVAYRCTVGDSPPDTRGVVLSPDSAWAAFVHDHDLWIRRYPSGTDSTRLTTDGGQFHTYGLTTQRAFGVLRNQPQTPNLRWSPDSRRIAVIRVDERNIEHVPFYSSTSQRPRGFTFPYALPGDSIVPRPAVHILDIATRTNLPVTIEPEPAFLSWAQLMDSTWIGGSGAVRVLSRTRGHQHEQLVEIDAGTGTARVLAVESNRTFVDLNHRGPANWWAGAGGDDVILFSQRDGWGHLWRFDRNGTVRNQVTSGPWVVHQIQHVDAAARRIYFTAWGREAGRNPYFKHLYRVGFDGSGLQLLTPEDADHVISFSPNGRYFVDQMSTFDTPARTVLRSAADGRVLRVLEEADISQLVAIGWVPPELFRVKARDGVTDIYGLLYKPSDFDPSRKYPVVNYIYPGPQIGSAGDYGWSVGTRGNARALAELGFIVTQIDHLGTVMRSKAFHDHYYGNMADHGLPDHVAALRQLAAARPYMDLDRVGIYGHSGGGFASTAAMFQYPDFFHVAVSTAGNHDNRTYGIHWGEKYQGLLVRDTVRNTDNYVSQANATHAANLRGRLMLMHGDMDDNVHPAMTLQVVNALIEHNKDFDLIILPDRAHGLNEPYVIRRTWDYFVTHLLGGTPPREYLIRQPGG